MSGFFRSRVVRCKELAQRLTVSEVTIWRWEREGVLPPKCSFGPNTAGWLEDDLNAWWTEKASASRHK